MPSVVYTWPEIASVGLAEHEVKAAGRQYKVGKVPFSANGRARTMAETSGFVKFVSDAQTDEILGCHIIGANASDLLAEVVLAMEFRGTSEDVCGDAVERSVCLGCPNVKKKTLRAAVAIFFRKCG